MLVVANTSFLNQVLLTDYSGIPVICNYYPQFIKNRDRLQKHFKMKRIKNLTLGILGATVLSFGLYACSNDDSIKNNQNSSEVVGLAKSDLNFIKMNLPKEIQSFHSDYISVIESVTYINDEGVEKEGLVRLSIPDSEYKIVNIEFSQDLIEFMSIDENYFINNSEDFMTAYGDPENNSDKKDDNVGDGKTHGERIKYCFDNFEKGNGRGNCVAGEWVTTIGNALGKIGGIFTKTIQK